MKKEKGFFVFWLIVSLIWLAGGVRHFFVSQDISSTMIYVAAAVISAILAYQFYKNK